MASGVGKVIYKMLMHWRLMGPTTMRALVSGLKSPVQQADLAEQEPTRGPRTQFTPTGMLIPMMETKSSQQEKDWLGPQDSVRAASWLAIGEPRARVAMVTAVKMVENCILVMGF